MSRVFAFILGKGKEELEDMLKDVEKKIAQNPENHELVKEKEAIEKAIAECAD